MIAHLDEVVEVYIVVAGDIGLAVVGFAGRLEQPVSHEDEVEQVDVSVAIGVAVRIRAHLSGSFGDKSVDDRIAGFIHQFAAEGNGVLTAAAEVERPVDRVGIDFGEFEGVNRISAAVDFAESAAVGGECYVSGAGRVEEDADRLASVIWTPVSSPITAASGASTASV